MHWSSRYIGQPYELGSADCARLLSRVRKEVFHLPVPDEIEIDRLKSRLGRVGQMNDLVAAYGESTDCPKEGDAVLMVCAGRPSHIGVYCEVNNEKCVLHAMENAGMVVLHKIRELDKFFLKVEGYYKWK
ncbi:hypothetical protein [Polynucleobacter paneuropaeus]|uniref:hypothetical protein n=1 Tax=Polynucleobacter paneuropaeus TaxID=2527775 RepID=UPI001BFDB331|nr:hypothetical protein [Polynucleobacter paneuropaeus]QWD55186.1 hypothetical protein C2750_05470 [Polynucleobacter paneuropaeus]